MLTAKKGKSHSPKMKEAMDEILKEDRMKQVPAKIPFSLWQRLHIWLKKNDLKYTDWLKEQITSKM